MKFVKMSMKKFSAFPGLLRGSLAFKPRKTSEARRKQLARLIIRLLHKTFIETNSVLQRRGAGQPQTRK